MSPYVGILPSGVLDSLLTKLNDDSGHHVTPTGRMRFLRLPHPRTAVPSLFLPHEAPESGRTAILEVQRISTLNQRSWFMSENEIIEDGGLLVFTPVDPVFLLIPILQSTQLSNSTPGTFRPADELFEQAADACIKSDPGNSDPKDPSACLHRRDLDHFGTLNCTKSAMRRICEVKEITTDIIVYRYSASHVVSYLKDKVLRLARAEVFEGSQSLTRGLAKDGFLEDGKESLLDAARIRAACELVSQYIPKTLYDALISSFDLSAVNTHLQATTTMFPASVSSAPKGAATTSTQEGGKKRKGQKGSHGVEKLKKANVKGMSKLSTFFKPKDP